MWRSAGDSGGAGDTPGPLPVAWFFLAWLLGSKRDCPVKISAETQGQKL